MTDKVENSSNEPLVPGGQSGVDLLHNPALNKGTAFTQAERETLGLQGLLPPHIHTQEEQVLRVMENFYRKPNDLERYIHMMALQGRNETLFFRVVLERIEEMMPIIYTPTVGQGCQEYGHIFRRPRGMFISAADQGRVAEVAYQLGLATRPKSVDLLSHVKSQMYQPRYRSYV
jgi:malate dehydrogenase (oxaloacetate-decarboxylating)(NADP+)